MNHVHPVRRASGRGPLLLVATAVLALLGLLLAPAAQASRLSGPQLDLLDPPATFAANSPFFINHGLCGENAEERSGLLRPTSGFELSLDGQPVRTRLYLEASQHRIENPAFSLCKQYLAGFDEGLSAGTHRFVGCWFYLGEDLGCEAIEVKFG